MSSVKKLTIGQECDNATVGKHIYFTSKKIILHSFKGIWNIIDDEFDRLLRKKTKYAYITRI